MPFLSVKSAALAVQPLDLFEQESLPTPSSTGGKLSSISKHQLGVRLSQALREMINHLEI